MSKVNAYSLISGLSLFWLSVWLDPICFFRDYYYTIAKQCDCVQICSAAFAHGGQMMSRETIERGLFPSNLGGFDVLVTCLLLLLKLQFRGLRFKIRIIRKVLSPRPFLQLFVMHQASVIRACFHHLSPYLRLISHVYHVIEVVSLLCCSVTSRFEEKGAA